MMNIYSIKFERDKLSKYDLTSVDSFNTCMNFDNRCNISTNNALRIIEPYNND